MIRVKICGNKSIDEVLSASNLGADAVGLIVGVSHFSEDAIEPNIARKILNKIPVFVTVVLVTHMKTLEEILRIYEEVPAPVIQLQDDISISEVEKIRKALPLVKLIKAIHVIDDSSVNTAIKLAHFFDAILLDSIEVKEDKIGGTGKVHDWNISRKIVSLIKKPVILAGGLTPDNVVDAISYVKPYGVDVNSGVDNIDGKKSPEAVEYFINRSKSCL
ncbi:MAG: hypothetical protein ACAF41_03100 [Leptolyngbya sp. BL-A-14]